jgi:hypothetical protein
MYILRAVDGLSSIIAVQSGEPTNLKPLDKTLFYCTVERAAGHFNGHDKGGIEFIEPIECRKSVTCSVSVWHGFHGSNLELHSMNGQSRVTLQDYITK